MDLKSKQSVHITVDLLNNYAHLFTVTMSFEAMKNQQLSMPVWTPGSYMIREFAQHIIGIKAQQNGKPIAVEKINKNTFEVQNDSPSITVTYQVYGFDSSIRAAYIDDAQAFFNGTALFLRPHGYDDAEFLLTIKRPGKPEQASWQVATNLAARDVDTLGFGVYVAENFDSLVDHPVQVSEMKRLKFLAQTIPHEIALVGDVRPFDESRLVSDLAKLCETTASVFSKTPFTSYLFIARFEENAHGGLEHRNSSMLLESPYSLPKKGMKEPDGHYRNFLSLCAHEYFHAWNVKRLKPANFIPYDFDNECYTTMLWIFEGITSYYDDILVHRAGLISDTSYLEVLSKNYTRLLRTPGRNNQSIAEASFDAWIKFYRPHENSQNTSVSYYLKGGFVALILDLLIREHSHHKISLDDVMRTTYEEFFEIGLTEEKFFSIIERVGGIDADDFKRRYVYGTEDLPLAELCAKVGIDVSISSDELALDDKTKMSVFLGLRIKYEMERAMVAFVDQDGPSMKAGLSPFDEVIAINGVRLDLINASDLFSSLDLERPVDVLFARKRRIKRATIYPDVPPKRTSKFMVSTAKEDGAGLFLVPAKTAS